jgi:hypothetical protein
MLIDRIFLTFMIVCGLLAGGVLLFFPESRESRVPPYFWVLIPMAIFEAVAFVRGHGAPGTVITVWSRLIGFVIAIVLMLTIPYLAGQPVAALF